MSDMPTTSAEAPKKSWRKLILWVLGWGLVLNLVMGAVVYWLAQAGKI